MDRSHVSHRTVRRAHPPHENDSVPTIDRPFDDDDADACDRARRNSSVDACSAFAVQVAHSRHHEHRAFGARRSFVHASYPASDPPEGHAGMIARWTRQRSSSLGAVDPLAPLACASHPGARHGTVRLAHAPHLYAARKRRKPSETWACAHSARHHEQCAMRTPATSCSSARLVVVVVVA